MFERVLRSVEAFEARTGRELTSRDLILRELRRLPAPFDRWASRVHVTGSAVVLGRRGTILHRHKRLGIWLQPGGHLDPGETPWEAALRETREETGLPGELTGGNHELFHLDVHEGADEHLHLDLRYLVQCVDAEPAPGAGESQEARWFSLEEASRVADAGLVDAIGRLKAFP